ncbi:MAG: LamG-like jellyroll fold domain-containing protein, partial [Cyanobacteria bacterium P01_D01_bin.36]
FVETIINAPEGTLDIGSASRGVDADKKARIVFTSDRAINTGRDPQQLGKGLVSHGEVNIYGADKQDKVRLAKDASAGDTTLTFKDSLKGWQIGDEIVLAGTSYRYNENDKTNSRFRDEVLTITEIKGKQIRFINKDAPAGEENALRFDHKRHSQLDPKEIDLYAANLSRNVSFETENGKNVPINRRAHVMLMHNPNVKVFNAGFYDLGRSDKTKLVDDIGKNVDGSVGKGTNIRGRYALHLHQTGLDPNKTIILNGNAVSGSPGWGIVQHESRAGVEDNVVFDVAGAGIVAESGNETGWWTDNLSIKSTGIRWDVAGKQREAREKKFDLGFEGNGFWVQGAAQIANRDNIAISANDAGMSLFSGSLDTDYFRPVETIPVASLPSQTRKLFAKGQTEVDIRLVPMATVSGFEGYNSNKGLEVWGHKTNFDGELNFSEDKKEDEIRTAHSGRSLIKDFKTWGNLWDGLSVQYSSNIDVKNGIVAGIDNPDRISGGRGVFVNHATFDTVIDGVDVQGFKQGAHFEKLNSDKNFNTNTLQNSTLKNNTYHLSKVADEKLDNNRADDFNEFLKIRNNRFEEQAGNKAPTARFSSKGIGGLSVEFDASASYDPDPYIAGDGKSPTVESKGIASYGWDVNNDGKIDSFGRTLRYTFSRAGEQKVSLTVIDAQGKATTSTESVNVQPTDYGNAFLGGDFGPGTPTQEEPWMDSSRWSNGGWFVGPDARIANGVATLSKVGKWSNQIGQVVRNEKVHKGNQTLNFRLRNLEGSTERETWKNNEVTVKLWGVDGQFENSIWDAEGPSQVGTLPMQRTELVSQTYGGENAPASEFFDWKDLSFDVNLGQGYEYLLFQVNATRALDGGDRIELDDVSLTGKANTTPGPNPDPDPNPPTPPSPPNGLLSIAKLSFEEGKGTKVADLSTQGMNNFGRLRSGASWIQGVDGTAAGFDGDSAVARVKSSEDINRDIHGEKTVSLWFKADKATQKGKQVIFEEGNSSRGMNLYLDDGLLGFGGWNRPESKWAGDWKAIGSVKSGEWNHVALVLDGDETVQDKALTAYLNGKQVGQVQGSQLWKRGGLSLGNVTGSTRFEDGIGRAQSAGFAGGIDELEVFNQALGSAQVQKLAGAFS